MDDYPVLQQTVLDTTDVRGLAEFYRQLLGLEYRPGDEPADPDDLDWLVLDGPAGGASLAFQKVDELPPVTWPEGQVPQQLHLDITVADQEALDAQHERVLALGGTLLLDRSEDEDEPLRVYADPSGHPFCLYVG
jgi:catechol 2,3-dioxygenase-like lactoylglutathione lyase family enzyme